MASSSSSYHSVLASSSSQKWMYDVFLSFRGEDTRRTFVDHLYIALEQQGIYTYKDDEKLPRGELIGPSLFKAIEESQIAIVVFSKNYTDSSWCLKELAHVLKCREKRGLIVMPVFYDEEPSKVRKQKGKFGKIFSKHRSGNSKKVEFWKKALEDACNISGWEPKNVANGHEGKCIKEIVNTISHRVHPRISGIDENLIGIEVRVEDLKSKLQIESNVVLMIGIWGLGGGGKTTLASTIYHQISRKFDGCCFVENVREDSRKYNLKKLQKKILSGVLKEKVEVMGVEEGRRMIMSRLCHRKVLIVLDDVDDREQLEALAGSYNWFGEGSRIIITTRDQHLLNTHNVNVVHNIMLLNDEDGIKLFCKHAPQGSRPSEDYNILSRKVVSYTGGLPLALIVIGNFLCDKDISEWRSALVRLKKIPETSIVEKLKISYDGLKPTEKKLFLDIACFFRRHNKDEAMEILDACGFYPVIGIKVLIQKGLITLSEDGKFDMHDLIQEMGHYIVRGEHPDNPEKHSRVWEVEDVQKICAMDTTMALDNIKAIRHEPDWIEREHEWGTFDDFENMNYFIANTKNLRWISWKGFSGSSLPTNFPPVELCCLIFSQGLQTHLWEGLKYLPNLRMIKLSDMEKLIKTPDFAGLPNLERLIISGCRKLKEIDPSIGDLKRLLYLHVSRCFFLKKFPTITRSHNVKTYEIINCNNLVKAFGTHRKGFSVVFVEVDSSGKEVDTQDEDLDMDVGLPGNIFKLIGLDVSHTSLTNLTLKGCGLGDGDIDSVIWDLPSLKELDLGDNHISQLDFSLLRLPRLKFLNVSWCIPLAELSGLPSSIAVVKADSCFSLKSVGDISSCKWLWNVSLLGENKLGPLGGDIVQQIMLQGNVIEHHFISYRTNSIHHIPRGLVSRLVGIRRERFRMELPENWYNHFSGFLICIATKDIYHFPSVRISITKEVEKVANFINEAYQESDDAAFVGYVSFNSLIKDTTWLNSTFNTISISFDDTVYVIKERWLVAELVPRKSNDDHAAQITTDSSSEFYEKEDKYGRKTFKIQHHSNSSIYILWSPLYP